MRLAGTRTVGELIDAVTLQIWRDRNGSFAARQYFDPAYNELEDLVRDAVYKELGWAAPQVQAQQLESEWEERDRLARIGALAYAKTGF